MAARDYMTGVPSAGHIAVNGYWHSGRASVCSKPPCAGDPPPRGRDRSRGRSDPPDRNPR